MEMNAHYKDFTDELASLIDSQDYFQPPPSSYHFNGSNPRHSPSPQQQHQQQQQPYHHGHGHHPLASRSRSRSRPPSASESASAGSIGPARRSRRNNSVSGTSPPPPYARPHAIVIPATRPGNGSGWFTQSSASDFSLATPSSEMGPHQPHSPLSYTPFSIPEKGNPLDFSLYQSSPTSAYPYSPSSVPLTLANHHHPHPGPNPTTGNSLAGALSSSLPIQSSSIGHHPGSPGSTATLGPSSIAGPFGMAPAPYPVNPSSASPTIATAAPPPHPHPTAVPAAALSSQDKQALIANEKRRRRRESHNAVERRRRDNINEKITELATLIPECMLEGGNVAAPSNNGGSVSPSTEGHSHFLEGADPLLPVSMSLMKKEDIVKDEGDPTSSTPTASGEGGIVKANKGMILRKSVEYIRYLQQLVTAQGARNRELEQELKSYRSGSAPTSDSNSISSPVSTGHSISAMGPGDSSSTLTTNAANAHANANGKRRQNSTQSSKSIKRNGRVKVGSPSDQSGEGADFDDKDLPRLPSEHDHNHDHDDSSDPEGEYEDDLGDNGHFGGMLGGMAGMSGMVLADEGMRLEFSGAQHGQATRTTPAGARGRRTVRGTTSSTALSNNANVNQHQPIHPSHQQHPHTMQNVQGMSMNMNMAMFPDGLGMSVPVAVPAGMTTDLSMEMEVDPREHDAQAAAAAIERGRTSTRPTGTSPVILTQTRSFVGNGRPNGHPNGTVSTGNPNGVRLKEEMADVGVALGLGSSMGMGMGMLPMGMST